VSGVGKIPLAVALRYDTTRATRAPRVVAVGRGEIGRKIIETAREHGVPLEANPYLAEALASVEIDTEIPLALYEAIATILAFILRASVLPSDSPRATTLPP
jgi:flagellar biosynthesis protein